MVGSVVMVARLVGKDLRRRRAEAALLVLVMAAAAAALTLALALRGVAATAGIGPLGEVSAFERRHPQQLRSELRVRRAGGGRQRGQCDRCAPHVPRHQKPMFAPALALNQTRGA